MDDDSTYAPRSPNLSAQYRPRSPDLSTYAPRSPDLSAYYAGEPDAQPPPQPALYQQQSGQAYLGVPHPIPAPRQPSSAFSAAPNAASQSRPPAASDSPPPARSRQRTQVKYDEATSESNSTAPQSPSTAPKSATKARARKRAPGAEGGDDSYGAPPLTGKGSGRGRKAKKAKVEEQDYGTDKRAPGEEEGVDVRTKFPVARIKRIMQADEDVGKVAQVTPTAVSKALELFIISLVLKATFKARDKNSKKVTASHLKQAVVADEQFDFLSDIIAKVPDAPAKKEHGSDEEGSTRKIRQPRGRRKKDAGAHTEGEEDAQE